MTAATIHRRRSRRRWAFHVVTALFAVLVVGPFTYMASDRTPPFELTDGVIAPNPVRKANEAITVARLHVARGASSADGFAKLGVDLVDPDGKPRPNTEVIQDTLDAISKLPWQERAAAADMVGGVAVVTWKARFLRYQKPSLKLFGITFSSQVCSGSTQRELVDSQENLWPKLVRNRAGVYHPSADNPAVGTLSTPALQIPEQMTNGEATYHVTNFYYCNVLQRLLGWPIVAGVPFSQQDIKFKVVSR